MALALEREEQVARAHVARIHLDPGRLERAAGGAAGRLGDLVGGPQREALAVAVAGRPAQGLEHRIHAVGSCQFGRAFARDRDVVERKNAHRLARADDLALFVALAGDEDDVARAGLGDRRADRRAPVADLARARRAGEHLQRGSPPDPRRADCRR